MQNIIRAPKIIARRPVRFVEDMDGQEIALVTLKGGDVAKLFTDDYERLMDVGVSPNWFLNRDGSGARGYVRTHVPARFGWGNVAQVARLITQPVMRGLILRYADGDRLNLRRDNLVAREGRTNATAWEQWAMEGDEFAILPAASIAAE